jgi:hypothetical protein
MTDGYYWARHEADNTHFVVLREGGRWYACGFAEPMENFSEGQIVKRIEEPTH